jgi:hypothetical protein
LAKGILAAYRSRKQAPPRIGLGASGGQHEEDMLALSVPGQVQKLIEEATSENNLAQMFVGELSFAPPNTILLCSFY